MRLRVLTRFPQAREQRMGVEAAICPPRARGACPARGQSPPVAKDARRRLKTRFNYFGGEPNIDESRKARESAAERQRSRSEEDTGRRIGLCFFAELWAESE